MARYLLAGAAAAVVTMAEMPLPFTRQLSVQSPVMTGSDVFIACSLLVRDEAVTLEVSACDYDYGSDDEEATRAFQDANGLGVDGVFGDKTANLVLELHSADGYTDSGFTAASMGYKYKVHIPVYANRSIESVGTLFDAANNVMMTFPVRSHGLRDEATNDGWPDYGDGDYGLNQFTSNGNTPTGLVEIDLNSPEPDPAMYGPWPVNRVVRGLEGNAAMLLPNIRDGVLIHTGNWTTDDYNWDPKGSMPNSHGCLHSHPLTVEMIQAKLLDIGVVANDNPFSGKDYPYTPQGIAVIELVE